MVARSLDSAGRSAEGRGEWGVFSTSKNGGVDDPPAAGALKLNSIPRSSTLNEPPGSPARLAPDKVFLRPAGRFICS